MDQLDKTIELLEAEVSVNRAKERACHLEYERARKRYSYWRRKRESTEHLLFERRQGQLPLLEHEQLGVVNEPR